MSKWYSGSQDCQLLQTATAGQTTAKAVRPLIGNIVGGAIIRLIGAVLLEANDEWQLQHRYMQTEPMADLTPPLIDEIANQISTVAE